MNVAFEAIQPGPARGHPARAQVWWSASSTARNQGPNYKKILRLSYDVIITYDNRKSNLR